MERGKGCQQEWVFHIPTQKWDKEMIEIYKAKKDIYIMVWIAIWTGGRSDCAIITRDIEATQNGYSVNSYLKILNKQALICYEPGRI